MGKIGGIIACIIGGILMLIASIVGSVANYAFIVDEISKRFPEYENFLRIFLGICIFIAGAGGISVIVGAIIAFKVRPFIIWIVTGIMAGTLTGTLLEIIIGLLLGPASYGIIGVFITVFARKRIKKKKEDEAE